MTSRPSRLAQLRVGALAVIALAGLVAACEARLPTSAEVQQMDARSAERQVARGAALDSVTTYAVDGVRVSRETALAIPASEIASVMIRRRTATPHCVKLGDGRESCTVTEQSPGSEMSIRTRAFALEAGQDSSARGGAPRTALVLRVPGDTGLGTGMVMVERGGKETRGGFSGLIYIDGVVANAAALGALSPREIVSVQVLKGEAATKEYAMPAAANGVIRVTTSRGKAP